MKIRADLHTHSHFSDGMLSPAELMSRAAAAGVGLFALTDHDNMAGCNEGAAAAKALGLKFVRGMEVSSYLGAAKVHILGYGCAENDAYARFLKERQEGARMRAEDILAKANEALSLDVSMEEVDTFRVSKETPIHTMHIVRAFAARLHADLDELYRKVFAPGGRAFSDMGRPLPVDAVHIIHEMGGIAVLAHPAQILILPEDVSKRFSSLSAEEKEEAKRTYVGARESFMEMLTGAGLDGIECYHSTHTGEETERFLRFARERDLLVTGGSDFHDDGSGRKVGDPPFYAEERLLAAFRLL